MELFNSAVNALLLISMLRSQNFYFYYKTMHSTNLPNIFMRRDNIILTWLCMVNCNVFGVIFSNTKLNYQNVRGVLLEPKNGIKILREIKIMCLYEYFKKLHSFILYS